MISQNTIAKIFDTAQIEDVIEDYVVLKKRGANLLGLCPFHNEKTPSFTVSPTKNIYKCFGCGKAGNSVNFLMEHDGLSYPEALKAIANRYNIEVEETQRSQEDKERQNLADSLYIVNEFAKDFFVTNLKNHDEGRQIGLPYFKERGFLQSTIEKFQLGFAIRKSTALKDAAIQKGFNTDLMRKVGLISESGYDFFRDRVMFPIHNLTGKVIAFGGRTLKKDKKIPKYINSPESEIYVKNKVLYGIYQSKSAIRKQDQCLLVEGYTDVISLHQGGIENVVASSGTSLTEGQIRLIKRNTENIVIVYDGDLAGIKAALRGIDLILEQDMNVKVVLLPEDQDPDSYIQLVGKTEFETFIQEKAEDFILFKTNLLREGAGNDPVQMSRVIGDIVQSIARIPNTLKRTLYIKECANRLDIDESILTTDVNKAVYDQTRQKRRQEEAERRRSQVKKDQISRASTPKQADDNFPLEEPGYLGSDETYNPPFDEAYPAQDSHIHRQKVYKISDEIQERDILRILVVGGSALFDETENVTVGQYVISNLDDVRDYFENDLYIKTLNTYIQRMVDQEDLSLRAFTHHSDPEIARLAIDLSTSPYEMSENWSEKGVGLQNQPQPDQNYVRDAIHSLLRIKGQKIKKLIASNSEKIKAYDPDNIKDGEDMAMLLKIHQQLKALLDDLAKKYGTVVHV
ncbi:MAG: DNA primase [Flavobacteriales bacterium]|nr:DNA primase [Flavobacteriales bacterium]